MCVVGESRFSSYKVGTGGSDPRRGLVEGVEQRTSATEVSARCISPGDLLPCGTKGLRKYCENRKTRLSARQNPPANMQSRKPRVVMPLPSPRSPRKNTEGHLLGQRQTAAVFLASVSDLQTADSTQRPGVVRCSMLVRAHRHSSHRPHTHEHVDTMHADVSREQKVRKISPPKVCSPSRLSQTLSYCRIIRTSRGPTAA